MELNLLKENDQQYLYIFQINLRGKNTDKEFMKNVGLVLDLVLPIEPNVRVSNKNHFCYIKEI